MNELETDFLVPMMELNADKLVLKHKKPISFFQNQTLIKEDEIIHSDTIFDLLLLSISSEQHRFFFEHDHLKYHYTVNDVVFTISLVRYKNDLSCTIKKGSLPLYPNTDVVLPEIKVGNRYHQITSDYLKIWIVVGFNELGNLKCLVANDEKFEEQDVSLMDFLYLLRHGRVYQVK